MINVWQAGTPAQEQASLAMRHAAFCQGGSGQALELCRADQPGARHDRYDDHALFFGAQVDGRDAATARLVLGPDLPSVPVLSQLDLGLDDRLPGSWQAWTEPSRLAIFTEYQGTLTGQELVLRLLGLIIAASLGSDRPNCLMTMRGRMYLMLRWFPFELGRPFRYPVTAGGPASNEPIFPALANLHEVYAATRLFRPDRLPWLFPQPPGWYRASQVRPREELAGLLADNLTVFRQGMLAWRQGSALPVLPG